MRLRVRSITKSFRRAGLAFTETPREIDVEREVFEELIEEKMLVVEALPSPKDEPKKETGKGKDKEAADPGAGGGK